MPPKVKTERSAMIGAAFEIAKNEGIASITAQSVSAQLKTSVAPIFREFQTVEELRSAAMQRTGEFHTQYLKSYPRAESEFLSYGLAYIQFAKEYPHLFEIIMQPGRISMEERATGPLAFVVKSIDADGALSLEQAKKVFFHVWVYTHGIACLVYKGDVRFGEETVKQLLVEAFQAFYTGIKQSATRQKTNEKETS